MIDSYVLVFGVENGALGAAKINLGDLTNGTLVAPVAASSILLRTSRQRSKKPAAACE